VFQFKASISGTVASAQSGGNGRSPPSPGLAGVTVELEDASGDILATAVTDRQGRYRFDQLSGLSATGEYTVRLVVPSGFTQTSTNPSAILISRGDINAIGVDFVLARMK